MPLNNSDTRDSGQGFSDAICLFFDTIIHFVLEPECFPLIDLDLHGIEDLGVRLGMRGAGDPDHNPGDHRDVASRFLGFSVFNRVLIEFIGVLDKRHYLRR